MLPQQSSASDEMQSAAYAGGAAIDAYLRAHTPKAPPLTAVSSPSNTAPEQTAQRLFDLLTRREFCYLSKSRAAPYRETAVARMTQHIAQAAPVRLYLDLGGGYRASLRPGVLPLNFNAGLSEWFVLSQMARFAQAAQAEYAPGVRFTIVLDNLCALAVNDIPVANTEAYCAQLRQLIQGCGMAPLIDVLIESEHIDARDYLALAQPEAARSDHTLSDKECDNVQRFLGHACSAAEAQQRYARYAPASHASDTLIAPLIDGVRLTQRASSSTLCFRPFPGGDCRIQAGEVALHVRNETVRPLLLTNANIDHFVVRTLRTEEVGAVTVLHDLG